MDNHYTFFSGESGFSIYVALAELLEKRGDWKRENSKKRMQFCDLILGDRFDIPYHLLREVRHKMLINYFKGSHKLTLKASMAKTLRDVEGSSLWMPKTFILGGKEDSEQSLFDQTVFDAEKSKQPIWIVKPSSGCKGEGVLISRDAKEIEAFVQQNSGLYVAQQYIQRPLLINGRKFDIRVWALLCSPFSIYLFREGSCRTSSVKYDLTDLSSTHSHLTNHCLQTTASDFGKYEPGNELWYDQLDEYLLSVGAAGTVRDTLEPQFEDIIIKSLTAIRELIEVPATSSFSCFQLFGYDFIADEDMRVHLLEINGSPGAADHWLNDVISGITTLCIDAAFPPQAPANPGDAVTAKWKQIFP